MPTLILMPYYNHGSDGDSITFNSSGSALVFIGKWVSTTKLIHIYTHTHRVYILNLQAKTLMFLFQFTYKTELKSHAIPDKTRK